MRVRRVVTAFLREPDGERILLGRRSSEVRTYPGRWAGISGSIEERGPYKQALTELHEETGLTHSDVSLLGVGRRTRATDWKAGTRWIIYPFMFRCEEPDLLRRNWEHTRFQWSAPRRIRKVPTVPKLWETYISARNAARAGGREPADHVFQQIEEDTDHGAEELGLWTLDGLLTAFDNIYDYDEDAPAERFKEACRTAAELRPSMAPPVTAGTEAYAAAVEHEGTDRTRSALRNLLNRREAAPLEAARRAAERLEPGSYIVTLSYSSTVLATLHEAAEELDGLVVGESRPACEGRRTARLAALFGIPVTLMTDAAAASATRNADAVLLGADALTDEGAVVNKMGSRALAATARFHDCPTIFVTTESKILPAGRTIEFEEKGPEELGERPDNVRVSNVYFESVPHGLAAEVVSENGILEPGRLREEAESRSALLAKLSK